ncbi:A24 family peptidase [Candidatus Pacearchaeota archaeon]|nr:A24 family peptidase [Candidatus Pacearchaeota archaeon]
MNEVIFLWLLAFVYIIFAVIQDLRKREIADWLNFSLIIFALGFRFFYSLFVEEGFVFFYQGIIGLGIFFVLGNLFYYGKVFAGGDAKLMIALGAVLPYYPDFFSNVKILFNFLFIFLSAGFVYISIVSIILCIKNFKSFKKEFFNQLKKNKKLIFFGLTLCFIFLLFGFANSMFFIFGIMVLLIFFLYPYSKAIDETCMVKKIKSKNLREGDWLYSDIKIGRKMIKAKWDGVTKQEIREIIKRYKEVKIKEGIPFSPVFIFSFIILIILILSDKLWNPFW